MKAFRVFGLTAAMLCLMTMVQAYAQLAGTGQVGNDTLLDSGENGNYAFLIGGAY